MTRWLSAAILAANVLAAARAAEAGEFDVIAAFVPADSVLVVGIDVGALRETPAAHTILEGLRPGELFEPLRPFVLDGVGADALPAATVLFASPSFANDEDDVLVAIVFDSPQPAMRNAAVEHLEGWEVVSADPTVPGDAIYLRNGVAMAFPDASTALLGAEARVRRGVAVAREGSRAAPPDSAALSGAIGDIVIHASAPPAGAAWTEWLREVSASVTITETSTVTVRLACAPEDQAIASQTLSNTLTPMLESPQLAAFLPGPPPSLSITPQADALTIRFALEAETWDGLVRSAAAAVQSEFR